MGKEKITQKQMLFIKEYLVDLNATQAAKRAGYKGSDKVLAQVGSENLRKPEIAEKIQKEMDERAKRTQINADDILKELARIGYSDIRKLYNDDGQLKSVNEWPEDLARAVASIEVDEIFEFEDGRKVWTGYTKKVKFWNKPQALELMGKHKNFKLWTDKLEITDKTGLAERLQRARNKRQTRGNK
jgi:phage terminase small subunit